MKVAVAFALVAACIAASQAAPAPARRAVDWRAVATKVGEIETTVRYAVQQIKTIANQDNASVGSAIGSKLDAAAVRATAILQQASDAVRDQTLTESQARQLLGQLKDILAGVQQDLQADIARLSTGAQQQIRDIFYATYATAEEKAQELYALLAAFARKAINWTAVANKVSEIESLVRTTVRDIKEIAIADNAQVGNDIAQELDNAQGRAESILELVRRQIADGTLTEDDARDHLRQLKDLLLGLQGNLRDKLNLLSPTAASQIRNHFDVAYNGAEQRAQELYALLRQ